MAHNIIQGRPIARQSDSAEERKKAFDRRFELSGGIIPTNPHSIDAREQALKDTWTIFYQLYCCSNGLTHDKKTLRNQSSGNFPNYFRGSGIRRIRKAISEPLWESGAYMDGVEKARERIAPYYHVKPRHLYFSAGISDGIEVLHKVFLNNTMGRVLIPNETYPTHLSTAMTFGGRNLVVSVDRDPETAIPDFSGCKNGNNPFVHVGFSSFIPYDNPNPIVYPEHFFRNDFGTGIFDLNEHAFVKDGIVRPIVLDMIYQSFSWPEKHVSISKLIELSDERNILVFLNSISKVFLEPNKRAGVIALHIPNRFIERAGAESEMARNFESDFQRKLCPISNTSIAALVAAHEMLTEDENGAEVIQLRALREKAKERFIGLDGKGGNQALMCSLPYVKPLHPNLAIESSGYNMFYIDGESLPWKNPEYKKQVLGKLKEVLGGIEDTEKRGAAISAFDTYLSIMVPERAAPSDIFCLDLVMETGVALVPAERFYKIGEAPDMVAFRPVMIAEPSDFKEAADLLGGFLEARIGKRENSSVSQETNKGPPIPFLQHPGGC